MSFEKNYEVGSIRLDAPNKHFVHELPLLSFGDARNSLDLSLIFQSKLTSNPFFIANGYKLNLQKRIIFSGSYPQSYEDGNGERIILNRFYNKYAFDDGSQRFIRLIDDNYVLENPDYSTEIFDGNGNILSVKDKYGNTILSYTYSSGKLTSVIYKGKKTINIGYSGDAMQYIQFAHSGSTFKTSFVYSGNSVIVKHYSDVDYHITYSSETGNFEAYSANAGGAFSANYSYKFVAVESGNLVTIDKYFGNKKIDSITYNFVNCDDSGKANILDVTDFHNVTTRVQFMKEKPAYSYELLDNMFVTHPGTNDPYYPGSVTFYNNEQASGSQNYGDGLAMDCCTDTDYTDNNRFSVSHNFSGMITVSGWLKPIGDLNKCNINIYTNDTAISSHQVTGLVKGVWTYFTVSLYVEDSTSIKVVTSETNASIYARDFRLSGRSNTESELNIYKDNLAKSSGVLIHTENGVDYPIPITDSIEYINGASLISRKTYPMTVNDLMRYKINQEIGTNKGEIYYNDGRGILALAGVFYLRYRTAEGKVITASLTDLAIGKMSTSKNNVYVTKTNFYSENGERKLKTQSLKNSYIIKEEIYDNKLDLIKSTVENVTTTYVRNANTGLVESQMVTDKNNTSEISSLATYDANDYLVSTTDEFGTVTTYTTDPIWGVVTKTAITSGLTVTDEFDDDCSTQVLKSFGNTSSPKEHKFGYLNGFLSTLENDTLNYTMGYSADDLSSITKNNQMIEQINISDDRKTVTACYPNSDNPIYTITQRYDDYGRLTEVDDILKNTYDVNPTYESDAFNVTGHDNSSGKLAQTEDKITGNVTKYAYNNNKLTHVTEFDSDGNKVSIETLTYDSFNRPKTKKCIYDPAGSKSVSSTLSYKSNDGNSYEGDIVKTCTYKVNDVQKSYTANSFDSFNRLYMKETKLNQNNFIKRFTYSNGRISGVSDTVLNMNLGTNNYSFDSMGRIVSNTYSSKNTSSNYRTYKYDQYGQLIRENNEGLDKTFVYEYNSIGNIVKVREYDFTLSDTPTGNNTEKAYTYSSTCPDRLIKYGNNSISYNSIGYPVSYGDKAFVWTNGKLTRLYDDIDENSSSSSEDIRFTYNAHGQRIAKSYVYDPGPDYSGNFTIGIDTTYDYDQSGRLIREFSTEYFTESASLDREFIYLYDENDMVGVLYSYNGSTPVPYYYHRNLQGDVIAIYDASGYTKAEYTYDAWGNCTVTNSTLYDLAYNNPIRYRGYYYDRETGLYYLNARYYNPEWRRFISPDSTEYIDSENPNGLNLYAYCNNDPVNYKDPSGRLAITTTAIIVGAFIGFVIGATSSVVTQLEEHNGDWSQINVWEVAFDGAFGAINGGLAASGINIWWSMGLGAVLGFGSSVGKDYFFNNKNIDWCAAINSFFIGAIAGAIAGAGANYAKDGMQVTKFVNSRNILNRTIANGTKRAIARQTHAMNVHAIQLLISGVRYMGSNTASMIYTMCTN